VRPEKHRRFPAAPLMFSSDCIEALQVHTSTDPNENRYSPGPPGDADRGHEGSAGSRYCRLEAARIAEFGAGRDCGLCFGAMPDIAGG
jgi:hypothetical protein